MIAIRVSVIRLIEVARGPKPDWETQHQGGDWWGEDAIQFLRLNGGEVESSVACGLRKAAKCGGGGQPVRSQAARADRPATWQLWAPGE